MGKQPKCFLTWWKEHAWFFPVVVFILQPYILHTVTDCNRRKQYYTHMQQQSSKHNSTTNTCSDNIHTYKEYRISVLKNKATNHLIYMVAWHAQHVKSHQLLRRKQRQAIRKWLPIKFRTCHKLCGQKVLPACRLASPMLMY